MTYELSTIIDKKTFSATVYYKRHVREVIELWRKIYGSKLQYIDIYVAPTNENVEIAKLINWPKKKTYLEKYGAGA